VRDRHLHWHPREHYGEGEGGHHDASGEEPGKLLAGVAAVTVIAVPPRYKSGDGRQKVENYHREGVPVVELWQCTG